MSEKLKRSWFRFHLLTAAIGMAVMGVLIGLNIRGGLTYWGGATGVRYIGWPMSMADYQVIHDFGSNDEMVMDRGNPLSGWWSYTLSVFHRGGHWQGIVFDPVLAILIVAAVMAVSELFIRRKENRERNQVWRQQHE